MNKFKKYLIYTLILFFFIPLPSFARQKKTIATIQEQIDIKEGLDGISFITQSELTLSKEGITIPKDSIVYAYILDTQQERRWHKSGYAVCKLKGYITQELDEPSYSDIEKKDIYIVIRTHKPVDKKEVGKKTGISALAFASNFIVPGAGIAYYFTRGMIKKEEGKTRFKSGVSNVYNNSVFWFWLKGKPVNLEENTDIYFKEITREQARNLLEAIQAYNERSERMQDKKETVKEFIN